MLWLRGQTNKPCAIAITFFIKPPHPRFPNTRSCRGFFLLSLCARRRMYAAVPVSYRNLMRNAASDCTWGIFKERLPCHCRAKYSANSSPPSPARNVQRMSAKLATDAEFVARSPRKGGEKKPGEAPPEFEVIIYLICSPNKLLTLIFVSQRVPF